MNYEQLLAQLAKDLPQNTYMIDPESAAYKLIILILWQIIILLGIVGVHKAVQIYFAWKSFERK